jgi:hypothetical protein
MRARPVVQRLVAGETVENHRESGNSMVPLIRHREPVTLAPVVSFRYIPLEVDLLAWNWPRNAGCPCQDCAFVILNTVPRSERRLQAGFAVHAFNQSRGVLDEMARNGTRIMAGVGDVARHAEIVLTCRPTEQA